MKLFKVIVVTSSRTKHECFIVAGNDVEAKRIAEEETGLDIISFTGVEQIDMSMPALLCEVDITDR